jgi:transcription initiation factor TFIIB
LAQVERSRVANAYKTLNTELGLPTKPVTPQCFVPKLASELELGEGIRRRASCLAARARKAAIANGCQPTGVAAACVYIATQEQGEYITQMAIAETAGTTPITLRNRRDELRELIEEGDQS